ncbi:MAG: hypothetical protein ACI9OJ_005262, partial [Myxococcota bacterium]
AAGRAAACLALGSLPASSDIVEALVAALVDNNGAVRAAACGALEAVASIESAPPKAPGGKPEADDRASPKSKPKKSTSKKGGKS